MEKNRKRALRRYHNHRLYTRARYIVDTWFVSWEDKLSEEKLHLFARHIQDNRQQCSCTACGNPRNNGWSTHREALTMPERKALDSFNDAYQEVMEDYDP